MILLINACVRTESRTKRLADRLIAGLNDPDVREIRLWEMDMPHVDEAFINRIETNFFEINIKI